MEVLKRSIKPQICISFLHIYQTTWGTAGDICLIRQSVVKSSRAKFIGHIVRIPLPKGIERDYLADLPILKVAGYVGDGHPKDPDSEWEAYEGVDAEIVIAAMRPWGFKLIEFD